MPSKGKVSSRDRLGRMRTLPRWLTSIRPTAETGVRDFKIPQLVRAGETNALALLPSFIYLANPHEPAPEMTRLPWGAANTGIIGECARREEIASHYSGVSEESWHAATVVLKYSR